MKTLKVNVRLPLVWKRLINVVFPDDLHGITSEREQKGVDDPESHYDDTRCVEAKFEDGSTVSFELCSGQSNYYGGVVLYDAAGDEVVEEILESWTDGPDLDTLTITPVDVDNVRYVILIEWYGTDPYAAKK